ncbi:MAG: hypothetical protein ACRDHW_02220 [Ktedonobacteraceae bacterium]
MKNMIPGNDVAIAPKRETGRKKPWYKPTPCSVCTSHIWLSPIEVKEPLGAPEPRHTWVLCKGCHEALLREMRRSPVRSSLRLRIALGLVAAERSPTAYSHNAHARDQRRIVGIAVLLFLAMILHLAIVVAMATTFLR